MFTLIQAGAIPFRIRDARCEFLLVTSHSGKWIFPKGIVEPEEAPEETALKEAREEAGVVGSVVPGPLGSYPDRKWQNDCEVRMYLLEYGGDCDSWEEGSLRRRTWTSFEEAQQLITKPELREMLERAQARLKALPR